MKDEEVGGYIIIGLLAALMFAVSFAFFAIYYSWVGVILWGWFIVPLGVKQISMAHMCGIMAFLGLVFRGHKTKYKNLEEDNTSFWVQAILSPILALGFGAIYKFFM